jgi:hypothetical protein
MITHIRSADMAFGANKPTMDTPQVSDLPASATPATLLDDVLRRAPENLARAAISVLEVALADEAKAPFVARALGAVTHIAEQSTKRSLLGAAGAASETLALLQAIDQPDVLAELEEDDPLIAARIRGAMAKRRLLSEEGGVCSAAELGQMLGGLSRQAIDKRRQKKKLLALDLGRHGYGYPLWQVHDGAVLPGLEVVLDVLRECDSWTRVGFFLSPNSWLGGETPLAELRRGEVDRVVATAEMFIG